MLNFKKSLVEYSMNLMIRIIKNRKFQLYMAHPKYFGKKKTMKKFDVLNLFLMSKFLSEHSFHRHHIVASIYQLLRMNAIRYFVCIKTLNNRRLLYMDDKKATYHDEPYD